MYHVDVSKDFVRLKAFEGDDSALIFSGVLLEVLLVP